MNVTIIGAGNVCQAMAKALVHAGHTITIASRERSDAEKAAADVGGSAAGSNAEAARGADLVILATPAGALEDIARELRADIAGKVVVDVSNHLAGWDAEGPVWEPSRTSGAERLQEWLPGAKVVKAFNTVFAHYQGNPMADGQELDALIAGDDAAAKTTVMELARSMGFRPINAGSLKRARELEALGSLNMALSVANPSWHGSNAWKILGVPSEDGTPPRGTPFEPVATAR